MFVLQTLTEFEPFPKIIKNSMDGQNSQMSYKLLCDIPLRLSLEDYAIS